MNAATEHAVTMPDGRILRVVEAGRRDGRPVLFFHGSPGAGDPYGPHVEDAVARGIRLIGYDRPGYGVSTRHEGHRIADSAADVRAIAGALHIDRLGVWGMSGGGPHALACAALLLNVVVAAATFASPAPYGAAGLDFFAGMGEANLDDYKLMLENRDVAHERLPADCQGILSLRPENLVENLERDSTDLDSRSRNLDFARWIVGGMHAGLARGGDGWWDDNVAALEPWGFDVAQIRVPVQVWHGRKDHLVPFGHGEWLATHIPGAEARLTDRDGPGTIVERGAPAVHEWLLEHLD